MKTIGVLGGLGPQATMDFEVRVHRIYPHPHDQVGIRWEALPNDMLPALYPAVLAVDEGRAGTEENQIARAGLAHPRAQNVDRMILACTEIPFMLHEPDTEVDLINPLQLLAEATVRFAIQ